MVTQLINWYRQGLKLDYLNSELCFLTCTRRFCISYKVYQGAVLGENGYMTAESLRCSLESVTTLFVNLLIGYTPMQNYVVCFFF